MHIPYKTPSFTISGAVVGNTNVYNQIVINHALEAVAYHGAGSAARRGLEASARNSLRALQPRKSYAHLNQRMHGGIKKLWR